ncbi:GNAT family N-acetyltransferase [Flavitalea flava]
MESGTDIQHTHTTRGGKFFLGDPAQPTAEMIYRMAGTHKMIIDHTEVSEIHQGEGIGKHLIAAAVSYARQNQIRILPLCKFARAILTKTKEYEDVLSL